MPTPLTELRNIGPAMAEAFARAGVHDVESLREIGTDAAYGRLLDTGSRPHFIAYYVIEMALQGRPWNDCKGKEKERLRVRFDAIVAESKRSGLGELERILNEIGVVDLGRR